MTKDHAEVELRSKLQKAQLLAESYNAHFREINQKRQGELLVELLAAFREGKPADVVLRFVARLDAATMHDQEMSSVQSKARSYDNQLKEIANDKEAAAELEQFHNSHGY